MKKTVHHSLTLLALAGLTATSAWAQSSVTLSGIADAAVRSVSNEGRGSIKSMVSGSNSTSRLVFRGTEDLGAGLAASFWLEHGIALDTGSATGAFWDRRATVSLAAKGWGELRLGRDFVPTYSNWGRYDPFSYVGAASSSVFVSGSPLGPIRSAFGTSANTTVRSSNAVQFVLPGGLSGLEGGAMVAAGEGGTAADGQHRLLGLRLGWSNSRFGASVARATTQNNLTTSGKFTDTAVGGNVNLGFMRLSAAWRLFEQGSAEQSMLLLGAWVPVGAGEIKLSWNQTDMKGRVGSTVIDANGASKLGLGYVHNLSKRTALYGTLARINNDGASTYAVAGGPSGLGAGKRSSGYELGARHNF